MLLSRTSAARLGRSLRDAVGAQSAQCGSRPSAVASSSSSPDVVWTRCLDTSSGNVVRCIRAGRAARFSSPARPPCHESPRTSPTAHGRRSARRSRCPLRPYQPLRVVRLLLPVALVLLALGRGAACAWAQVNTETLRDPSVNGWTATGGGDAAFETGNADVLEVGLDARTDARPALVAETFRAGRARRPSRFCRCARSWARMGSWARMAGGAVSGGAARRAGSRSPRCGACR